MPKHDWVSQLSYYDHGFTTEAFGDIFNSFYIEDFHRAPKLLIVEEFQAQIQGDIVYTILYDTVYAKQLW